MSEPQSFKERYEQMRGSAAPPASTVEVAEAPVVVDLPDKPEGDKPAAPEKPQAAKAPPAEPKPASAPAGPKKKTVEELERDNQELQRQLAARPAPAAAPAPSQTPESKPAPAVTTQPAAAEPDPEPKPENYASGEWDPKFITDHTRWVYRDEHRKRLQADALNANRAELKKRFDAAAEKHPDFHEVAQRQIPVSETILKAIQASEHSGELFYYLGTHEAEAREIASLPEAQAWRKLIAIETQFTAAPAPGSPAPAAASAPPATIVQSRAPKPPTTVRPSSVPRAVTLEDINKMPPGAARQKAFVELRAQQGQKDARRLVATS